MKSYRRSIASALLASLVMASAPSAQAFVSQHSLKAAGGLGLFGSAVLLHMRRSVKNFKPRYSLEKLKDTKNMFTKEYLKNLWHFYYDGFVGQKSKLKVKLKAEAGEKVEFSNTEEIDPYGVLGAVDSLIKPFEDAAKTALAVFIGCKVALNTNDHKGWIYHFFRNKASRRYSRGKGAAPAA